MSTNNTTKLEQRVAKITSRSEAIAVGRAAWGLFALLSIWKVADTSQKIALPSFLCQSPLAATLLAGWEPKFCDVDPATGNVSDSEWQRVIDSGVQAVLFVHLFGNVGDAGRIADICKAKNIYFIEDAAQSFGGTWQDQPCGTFGNAALVSFGHTKLIDVGHGGVVLTNDSSLAEAVRKFKYKYTSIYTINDSTIAKQFQELFYAARHQLEEDPKLARKSFQGLMRIYQPLISSIWLPENSEKILARLDHLDASVMMRREKNERYMVLLRDTPLIPINMSAGSVPWRANFILPGISWADQADITNAVRLEGVDISNWYIPSHWLIEGASNLAGKLELTELLSKEIFQLWIDEATDNEKIQRSADVLTLKLKDLGYA